MHQVMLISTSILHDLVHWLSSCFLTQVLPLAVIVGLPALAVDIGFSRFWGKLLFSNAGLKDRICHNLQPGKSPKRHCRTRVRFRIVSVNDRPLSRFGRGGYCYLRSIRAFPGFSCLKGERRAM